MNRIQHALENIAKAKKIREKAKVYRDLYWRENFTGMNLGFLSENEWNRILHDADEICSGYYQIFNYPKCILKDWFTDPVTNRVISKAPDCSLIRISSFAGKTDVRNYWEAGHLHPGFTLGEAYQRTKNEKYARQAAGLIADFIRKNPCGKTIHWKCCMDAAIRAANITQTAFFLQDSDTFREKRALIAVSLAEHVLYIADYYEDSSDQPNNHYISDLAGVIIAGVYLVRCYSECEDIQKTLKDAISRLDGEMKRQIHQDGSDYENSTYYHCLVTELCCAAIQTLKMNDIPFPEEMGEICSRMLGQCEWMGAFLQRMPLIGDQDGSRLWLPAGFFDADRCDFSYLPRINQYLTVPDRQMNRSGIARLQKNDLSVYIKCGEIGTGGKGVHDHNDQLSVTVFYQGIPIVIDCGTCLYTKEPEKRKAYRATRSHSTLFIENEEQNDIDSNLFGIRDGRAGTALDITDSSFTGRFIYQSGVTHERTVQINDEEIVISDRLSDPEIDAHIQFIIPGEAEVFRNDARVIQCLNGPAKVIFKFDTDILIEKKEYSPAYGTEQTGYCVITQKTQKENITKIMFERNE